MPRTAPRWGRVGTRARQFWPLHRLSPAPRPSTSSPPLCWIGTPQSVFWASQKGVDLPSTPFIDSKPSTDPSSWDRQRRVDTDPDSRAIDERSVAESGRRLPRWRRLREIVSAADRAELSVDGRAGPTDQLTS